VKTWKLNPTLNPGQLLLVGPYDAHFVEALKQTIPSHAREWNSFSKSWRIDEAFAAATCELIAEHSQIEAPSDFVGLELVDASGAKVGTVESIAPKSGGRGGFAVRASLEPRKVSSFDELRELAESLGEFGGSAEVWDALSLIAEPTSVTVRIVDGKRVIVAELS